MVGKAWIVHPVHLGVALQELGDGLRVLRVALHPQGQRLEALQEEKAVERAQSRTPVPEHLDARLQYKRKLAERGVDLQPVVGGVWFGEPRELAVVPGEGAAIHYDTADRRAVPADELGGRVDDDVGAVLQGVDQVGRWQGVVDNEWDASVVGHRRGPLDIQRVERRVAYGLGIDGLRLIRDRRAYSVEIRRVGELHVYTDLGQRVVELVVGTAVELRRGDDLIAGSHDVQDRQPLGSLSRCRRQRANSLLQRGQPLLEDVGRGVHDPGVYIALFGEGEQVSRVVGIVEDIRGRLVDGYRPRRGCRVDLLPGMQSQGVEPVLALLDLLVCCIGHICSLGRSGCEWLYRFFEFFPVLQEGVVATKCIYLGVVSAYPCTFRLLPSHSYFGGGEEPVAGDPNEQHLGLDARVGIFLGLVASCHVVVVHRPGEVEVGVGVEAASELPALVVQVALDLEPPTELGVQRGASRRPPAEPLPLPGGALVGHHPRHPGDGQPPIGPPPRAVVVAALPVRVGHYGAPSDLAHPDPLRPESTRGRHGDSLLYEVGELYGPLQRLLPSDGTAGDEGQPLYAEGVEQAPLRPNHVPDRDDGKAHRVGSPRAWLCGGRTCAARAATDEVRADDEVLLGG